MSSPTKSIAELACYFGDTPLGDNQTYLLRLTGPLTRATLRARETLGKTNAVEDVSLFEQSLRNRLSKWLQYLPRADADGYSDEEIGLALANLVDQYAQYFELTAESFEDWNGSSELPISPARRPQLTVSIPVEFGTVEISPFPPAMLGETAPDDEYFYFEGALRLLRRRREPDPTTSPGTGPSSGACSSRWRNRFRSWGRRVCHSPRMPPATPPAQPGATNFGARPAGPIDIGRNLYEVQRSGSRRRQQLDDALTDARRRRAAKAASVDWPSLRRRGIGLDPGF